MTANGTFFESPVLKVNFEEPKTVNSGKSLNSYFDYDVKFNSTLTSAAEIRCERYGRKDNLTENIVGVDCWTLLGFPVHTKQGIEQTLYSCASVVEASGTLNIAEMNPWWGGVEFGEKLPNNSFLVSENTLLLPAGTSNIWDIDANAASAPVIAVDMMHNLTENIVGVDCWTLLGFPVHTKQGIEQTLYSCASVVEASVKTIKLQSSITGSTNVIDVQTIPAQWYIEKGTLNIAEMNPWWGGVEFGEKLPNNSLLVSKNTLLLPAGASNIWSINANANAASAPAMAVDMMRKLEDSLKGYRGDGIGNLALLQQWKEEGVIEKGISGIYKRQWNNIMINMVTPTNRAKIIGTTQFTVNKTCYDVRFATQYLIAVFGLIIIFCILLASLRNEGVFNSLIKIRHVVQQMDLGRAILNAQGCEEANIADSSQWVKIDGKKLMLLGEKGFEKLYFSENP
ncbi:4170_t:CDS:2 [Entrophospora sp. SA101]|nr:4170_t:CDS:2 [Entrophospora sp. SA101]